MTEPDQARTPDPAPADEPVTGPWSPARLRAVLAGRPVAALALLPLRIFLGLTYLYAGIDKFVSPRFLTTDGPFSVAGQMEGSLRASPLAPLIEAVLPAAVPVGALIALAEIAIGIGLVTGLAYRAAAWAGAGMSLLFWLTASWSVTPYYFSPDLPYAFGFLTLALAGHGHLLVIDPFPRKAALETGGDGPMAVGHGDAGSPAGTPVPLVAAPQPSSAGRRALLEVGILAALTIFTAGAVSRLRALGASETAVGGGASGAPAPATAPAPGSTQASTAPAAPAPATATPTAAPASTPVPTEVTGAMGPVIASVDDLEPNAGIPFTVPNEVPFALGPGGPGVLVQLSDGRIVAYAAACTHGRCTVAFDPSTSELVCPCHLGRFDPANAAAVLGGPPPLPLPEIPIGVDGGGQVHVVVAG